MKTNTVTAHLDDVERRLKVLERKIAALERLAAELRPLGKVIGDLKFEVEEMQEA
jgi:hypothetical protein